MTASIHLRHFQRYYRRLFPYHHVPLMSTYTRTADFALCPLVRNRRNRITVKLKTETSQNCFGFRPWFRQVVHIINFIEKRYLRRFVYIALRENHYHLYDMFTINQKHQGDT